MRVHLIIVGQTDDYMGSSMIEPRVVNVGSAEVELRVDAFLAASVLRAFAGHAPLDAEVDALPIPERPRWLNLCVRILRWYRRNRSRSLGQRCVFDPSCSRYAELAFRRHGPLNGGIAAIQRLRRCRHGAGGEDLP